MGHVMSPTHPGQVGLCFGCRHARVVETRTSRFWLCGLHATDARFPKYPRLPVLECDGYAPQPDDRESPAKRD